MDRVAALRVETCSHTHLIASLLCGGVLVDAGRLPAAPDLVCSVSLPLAAIAVLGLRQPVR